MGGWGVRPPGSFAGKALAAITSHQSVLIRRERFRVVERIWFSWVTGADGLAKSDYIHIKGTLNCIVTQPSASAPPAPVGPSDLHDLSLTEVRDGEDVAQGLIANRSTTEVETAYIFRETTTGDTGRVTVNGCYRLEVSDAGDGKAGVACVHVLHTPRRF